MSVALIGNTIERPDAGASPSFKSVIGLHVVERWERHEKSLTRRLATTAHFCARPAVLVVCRVTLTLFGASSARCGAGFDDRPDETSIRLGLSDHDTCCAFANVCTIEVEPYAARQGGEVVFAETCICARSTAGKTVDALLDAPQDC